VFETLAYAGGQTGAAAQPNMWVNLVPIVVIFGIFYFMLIRPQSKRQKAIENMLNSLKVGDKVITNGGIHGEIAFVGDKVLHLKIAKDVKIVISKAAIAGLQEESDLIEK
jgi:preprotein translocase subunit YajC